MANRKISDLTSLTAPATGDLLPIVDISEAAAANKNKKITYAELLASAPAGSAAAPSFSFDGDPNTGIYSPGADQLAIATGGTERFFVAAGGSVGIGTSNPSRNLEVASSDTWVRTTRTGGNSWIVGTGLQDAYRIYDDTAGAERLRVDTSGRLLVGLTSANTSGGILQVSSGLTFPATAVASADPNTLDDYEEGTWTPSLGGTATYTTNQATYTKIGRTVYVTAYIAVNSIGTGSTTIITGLPFSTATTSNWVNPARVAGSVTNVVSINWTASGTSATLKSRTAAAADDAANAIFQGSTLVELNGFYFV